MARTLKQAIQQVLSNKVALASSFHQKNRDFPCTEPLPIACALSQV